MSRCPRAAWTQSARVRWNRVYASAPLRVNLSSTDYGRRRHKFAVTPFAGTLNLRGPMTITKYIVARTAKEASRLSEINQVASCHFAVWVSASI